MTAHLRGLTLGLSLAAVLALGHGALRAEEKAAPVPGTAGTHPGADKAPEAPKPRPLYAPEMQAAAANPAAMRLPAHRVVRMTGRMPFLGDEAPMDADLTIEFALYTSPVGGRPHWKETRKVTVRQNQVDVALGEVVPLPDLVFTATFRFVSLAIDGGPELSPRWPIESIVWAGDPDAAPGAGYATGDAGKTSVDAKAAAPAPKPPVAKLPGTQVQVETHPRAGATYVEAALAAEKDGRRLPTLEEWFAARDAGKGAGFEALNGHYEWVQPFIYTSQSYPGGIASYTRKKINGCSGEELSPEMNRYAFRCVEGK